MEINNCPKCGSEEVTMTYSYEIYNDSSCIHIKCDICHYSINGIFKEKLITEWNKKMYKCPVCKTPLNESMFCDRCCSKWTIKPAIEEIDESNNDFIAWGNYETIKEAEIEWTEDELEEAMKESHNNGGNTDYYKIPDNAKYCQDIIESREMNFSQGNILKASFCFNIERGDSDYKRDLNKIIWFANRELDRIK